MFDTLVNPDRRMAATEIHGITGQHVADAPRFEEVASELLHALSDSVVAAHNVYFDLRFLQFELGRLGLFRDVPHVCTMHARPLLGLKSCSLNAACLADRIDFTPTHSSRSDSMAAALLWMRYRDAFLDRRILTFRDLTRMGRRYKFFSSFRMRYVAGSRHRDGSTAGPETESLIATHSYRSRATIGWHAHRTRGHEAEGNPRPRIRGAAPAQLGPSNRRADHFRADILATKKPMREPRQACGPLPWEETTRTA